MNGHRLSVLTLGFAVILLSSQVLAISPETYVSTSGVHRLLVRTDDAPALERLESAQGILRTIRVRCLQDSVRER